MMRNTRAGVTLIELLIAISLVSLLSVGVLMAMRVGLNAMETVNDRLLGNRRTAGTQRIIEQQIASLMVVSTSCRANPDAVSPKMPFFQGEPASMRFVSSYSLQEASRGYPRILEFQVIPGENNIGVRLVVNERLYSGPLSAGVLCFGPGPPGMGPRFQPIEINPQSFVLADRLARCSFEYLMIAPERNLTAWIPVWVGRGLPSAIRVVMASLEPGPSRLPVLTLTVPVRVNRNPMMEYVDQPYALR